MPWVIVIVIMPPLSTSSPESVRPIPTIFTMAASGRVFLARASASLVIHAGSTALRSVIASVLHSIAIAEHHAGTSVRDGPGGVEAISVAVGLVVPVAEVFFFFFDGDDSAESPF